MSSPLFVDTGGFLALLVRTDPAHARALHYYRTEARERPKVTTSLVLGETYSWLRQRVGYRAGLDFLEAAAESEEKRFLEVVRPTPELEKKCLKVIRRLPGLELSHTDALSFVVVVEMEIEEVFGFDRRFHAIKRVLVPRVPV